MATYSPGWQSADLRTQFYHVMVFCIPPFFDIGQDQPLGALHVHAHFDGRAQAARAAQLQWQRQRRFQHGAQPQQQRRASVTDPNAKSVIGNDLKIIGQGLKIISQGTLQVDGEIEGDVGGSEVIIGEQGKVTGTVAAERVIVRGKVAGVIRGAAVTLQSSARVEGDIHHMQLAIEQGAEFDGRCRRPAQRRRAQSQPRGRGLWAAKAQLTGTGCGRPASACAPAKNDPFSSRGEAHKLPSERNQWKGGDPMSSGILQSARTLKLDRAHVGAASDEA